MRCGRGWRSREILAQFAAQDFTGRSARDGFDEVNLARLLVMGEAVGDESTEFDIEGS